MEEDKTERTCRASARLQFANAHTVGVHATLIRGIGTAVDLLSRLTLDETGAICQFESWC